MLESLVIKDVSGGIATLRFRDEYEARLTLAAAPEPPSRGGSEVSDVPPGDVAATLPAVDAANGGKPAGGSAGPGSSKQGRKRKHLECSAAEEGAAAGSTLLGSEGGKTLGCVENGAVDMLECDMSRELALAEESAAGGPSLLGSRVDRAEQWRWRLIGCQILPELPQAAELMMPGQASQLQMNIEARMWAAADAADARAQGPASPIAPERPPLSTPAPASASAELTVRHAATPAPGHAGQSADDARGSSLSGASGRVEGVSNVEVDKQTPMAVMHGILRDVAARVALNEVVKWLRGAAADGPVWKGRLRLDTSACLALGVR